MNSRMRPQIKAVKASCSFILIECLAVCSCFNWWLAPCCLLGTFYLKTKYSIGQQYFLQRKLQSWHYVVRRGQQTFVFICLGYQNSYPDLLQSYMHACMILGRPNHSTRNFIILDYYSGSIMFFRVYNLVLWITLNYSLIQFT